MRIRTIVMIAASTLAAGALAAWLVGGAIIAPAMRTVPRPPDLDVTDLLIPSGDHAVAAWQIDVGGTSPVVLLVHGIRGNRLDMVRRARWLVAKKYSVVMIDLQAHGETPGRAITFGWRESRDVRAAIDWIRRTLPARRVALIGTSLGGASAVLGPQPLGVDALVLEEVYPRVTDAVEDRIRMRLGPLAPVVAPLLLAQLGVRLGITPKQLEPIGSIARVGAPVLIAGGSRDEHTTEAETRGFFAAASQPKHLWIVEGARHEDLFAFDPAAYEAHVLPFLEANLKRR